MKTKDQDISISFEGVEAYPVDFLEIEKLNYISALNAIEYQAQFSLMHKSNWEAFKTISNQFRLKKRKQFFQDINDRDSFNLIYFDAFGARNQPELWTEEIFQKMYRALKVQGVLVTYSAKGSVRRAMQEVGFDVQRLPGPPGKREMLRGIKI